MSAAHPTAKRGRRPGRIATLVGYEGPVAAVALKVFQFFLVSVSFLSSLIPAALFTVLVGWQATHFAILLGTLSLLPVIPATYATLAAADRALVGPGNTQAGREYWRSFGLACQKLWWAIVFFGLAAALLGYDLALLGDSDVVFLLAVTTTGILATLLLAVCWSVVETRVTGIRAALTTSFRAVLRRPHVALTWLLMIAGGCLSSAVPLVGPSLTLFAPALVATGIVLCNRALNFRNPSKELKS